MPHYNHYNTAIWLYLRCVMIMEHKSEFCQLRPSISILYCVLFPSDYQSFHLFLWLTFSPFHPFKQTLSINSREISFSQGFGVPKGINKSSQSF